GTMTLDEARRNIRRALPDLRAPEPNEKSGGAAHPLNANFPIPDVILVGLTQLLDLKRFGPGEKLRWGVRANFRNEPFTVTLEKFGPRLYVRPEARTTVEQCLLKVAKFAEMYLQEVANSQIHAGHVTIENQFRSFEGQYRFFRTRARQAYHARRPSKAKAESDGFSEVVKSINASARREMRGSYYATAMLDAYFSKLEHVLVLVLPFLAYDAGQGRLVDFVASDWGDKWKEVFGAKNREAMRVYNSLRQVKESIRNPAAHGGFAKKGTSFFFHVDTVGALPGTLSEHSKTEVRLRFPKQTFDELCE